MLAWCEDNENGGERQRGRFFMLGDKWGERDGVEREMRRGGRGRGKGNERR